MEAGRALLEPRSSIRNEKIGHWILHSSGFSEISDTAMGWLESDGAAVLLGYP